MANPPYLLFDADGLIQFFLVKRRQLFMDLITNFGVVPSVVPEVEVEIRYHEKFGSRFEEVFQKFQDSGHIQVLGSETVKKYLHARTVSPALIPKVLKDIQHIGMEYNRHVGRGEAFSHSAAVNLSLPLVTHDREAIDVLQRHSKAVATPCLRLFDIIVFAFTRGVLEAKECQQIIGELKSSGEWIPHPFSRGGKFQDCCSDFSCRIQLQTASSDPPTPTSPWDALYLKSKS